MTEFEIWSLVISGFAALGTVGAVIIALWATLHQRQRFKIKDIRVGAMYEAMDMTPNDHKLKEAYVYFLIENKQSVQFEVMEITLELSRSMEKSRHGLSAVGLPVSMRGNFIPPHSQYEVKIDILDLDVPCAQNEISDVTCQIKTSAGDITLPFPDKWKKLLFMCLKVEGKREAA